MAKKYKIIRFYKRGAKDVIKRGLSLKEAQEHCNNPKTKAIDWFDGYCTE